MHSGEGSYIETFDLIKFSIMVRGNYHSLIFVEEHF